MDFYNGRTVASREVLRGDSYRRFREHQLDSRRFNQVGEELSERLEQAATEAEAILADGQWHAAKEIEGICKRYDVSFLTLIDHIYAALEQHPRAVCLPDERTPDNPTKNNVR